MRDVVVALRAAAQQGRAGECYLVAGHRLSVRELAVLAETVAGVRVTRRTAPAWSTRAVAPAATVLARLTGSPLLPTREALHALAAFPIVDSRKAAADLGYRPRPAAQTLADLHDSFAQRGRLTTAAAPGGDATA